MKRVTVEINPFGMPIKAEVAAHEGGCCFTCVAWNQTQMGCLHLSPTFICSPKELSEIPDESSCMGRTLMPYIIELRVGNAVYLKEPRTRSLV